MALGRRRLDGVRLHGLHRRRDPLPERRSGAARLRPAPVVGGAAHRRHQGGGRARHARRGRAHVPAAQRQRGHMMRFVILYGCLLLLAVLVLGAACNVNKITTETPGCSASADASAGGGGGGNAGTVEAGGGAGASGGSSQAGATGACTPGKTVID